MRWTVPAPVVQDWLGTLHRRLAIDHPSLGPDRFGQRQVGAFLTHERAKQPAKELREGVDGHQVGRRGRSPLGPVGGDSPGRYQTVHMGMGDEGAGPGMEDAEDANEPADIMGVCGKLAA
jgi:hypothetical protein